MATPTYTLIDSVTLGSSASSVTFSSISATGKGDLFLALDTANDSGYARQIYITLNGDTGTNYSCVYMRGTGSVAESGSYTSLSYLVEASDGIRNESLGESLWLSQIMNYSSTTQHKTAITRFTNLSSSSPGTYAVASRWASTSAVTSITITANSTTFAVGSTFHLYQLVSE
jgi:hypothetical protein